jgi:hypothetical protein
MGTLALAAKSSYVAMPNRFLIDTIRISACRGFGLGVHSPDGNSLPSSRRTT